MFFSDIIEIISILFVKIPENKADSENLLLHCRLPYQYHEVRRKVYKKEQQKQDEHDENRDGYKIHEYGSAFWDFVDFLCSDDEKRKRVNPCKKSDSWNPA